MWSRRSPLGCVGGIWTTSRAQPPRTGGFFVWLFSHRQCLSAEGHRYWSVHTSHLKCWLNIQVEICIHISYTRISKLINLLMIFEIMNKCFQDIKTSILFNLQFLRKTVMFSKYNDYISEQELKDLGDICATIKYQNNEMHTWDKDN